MNGQPLQHIHEPAALGIWGGLAHSGSTSFPNEASGQPQKDTTDVYTPNIVLYGETGVGKSSIINLIAGRELAHTSNNSLGCTFQHQRYAVKLPNRMPCALWDTTGLDEGSEGTVPATLAESNLRLLIQDLANTGGIHLIIYCIRASRLTKALQRNYDLFYVTVCRKKVPVALVVTGLEHQQGEMEAWWAANEAVLGQYGMRFDAHACVMTLNVEDHIIQQRRLHSQRLLCDLVVRYSKLPTWKADPSFISSVLPMFRTVFHRTIAAGKSKKTTIVRKVVTCDMMPAISASRPIPTKPSADAPLWTEYVQIENRTYNFVHLNKDALHMQKLRGQHARPTKTGSTVGILVFYTSPLGNTAIPPEEVNMLEAFYEIAGGQTCPMIVVLRGCDEEERVAQECQDTLASHHKNILAYFTTLTGQNLAELIERLCIEYIEDKAPTIRRAYAAAKQWLVTAAEAVTSDYVILRRRRQGHS